MSWLDGKLLLGKVMRDHKRYIKAEQIVAIPGISDDSLLYRRQHHDQSDTVPKKQTERKKMNQKELFLELCAFRAPNAKKSERLLKSDAAISDVLGMLFANRMAGVA